jgi:glycosyltransferase involved in cell wall biosynthesis
MSILKPLLLCPHTNPSGGVKVVFRMAQAMKTMGHSPTVGVHRLHDTAPCWLTNSSFDFPVIKIKELNTYTLPEEIDCIVNFGDGNPYIPLPKKFPHILFLQGFGTQTATTEKFNLFYRYDGIIATTTWLANMAERMGHKKVFIASPGIDPIFRPLNLNQNHSVPIIGSLYHSSSAKNFALSVFGLNKLSQLMNLKFRGLFLSSSLPKDDEFIKAITFPHGWVINPPIHLMPCMYSSCFAWISPSVNEGFGLTTLEAMASGVPTLVYPNFGLNDFLRHGENCLIIRNKNDISENINLLFNNAQLRRKLVISGKSLANSFTWKKAAKKFVNHLSTILGK